METDDYGTSWSRYKDESAQAYRAFTAYIDLHADRSVDEAYRAVTGQQESKKRASGRFTLWSQQFEWRKRAEAYDAHLERVIRKKAEMDFAETHGRGLAAYKERQRRLSSAAVNVATGLLIKAGEGLQYLKPASLKPGELAALLRAAASVAETASNSEATALAVDELLKDLANRKDAEPYAFGFE